MLINFGFRLPFATTKVQQKSDIRNIKMQKFTQNQKKRAFFYAESNFWTKYKEKKRNR